MLKFDPYNNSSGIIVDYTPGNIINANLQGYTTYFNNNTPVDLVAYSLLQDYPVGPVGTVDYGKEQSGEQTQTDKDFEKRLNELFQLGGWRKEEIWIDKNGNIVPPNTPGATKSPDAMSRDAGITAAFSLDTWFGRISLATLGIVLLALGIWKLS